jgi:hypothetical protein
MLRSRLRGHGPLLLVSLGLAGTALADSLDPGVVTSALPTVRLPRSRSLQRPPALGEQKPRDAD